MVHGIAVAVQACRTTPGRWLAKVLAHFGKDWQWGYATA